MVASTMTAAEWLAEPIFQRFIAPGAFRMPDGHGVLVFADVAIIPCDDGTWAKMILPSRVHYQSTN